MDIVTVEGVPPYDGRYEFDLDGRELTVREWGWIKRFSGALPTNADEAIANSDAELMCTLAVIALRRAGKIRTEDVPAVFDRIADAPYTSSLHFTNDGATTAEDDPDEDPTESSNGSSASSGPDSKTSSETSAETPQGTGTPASAISASAPTTSES